MDTSQVLNPLSHRRNSLCHFSYPSVRRDVSRMTTNTSKMPEFILISLSHLANLQGLLFSLFLTIYLLTMASNLLIVVLFSADTTLQSPRYFFLPVLSALEIGYTSITVSLLFHYPQWSEPHRSLWLCSPDVLLSLLWCHRVLPPGSHGL